MYIASDSKVIIALVILVIVMIIVIVFLIQAFVDKVLVWPGQRIEIRWKFKK